MKPLLYAIYLLILAPSVIYIARLEPALNSGDKFFVYLLLISSLALTIIGFFDKED